MTNNLLGDFVRIIHEQITCAMRDADEIGTHPQYRLGVRRLAKAFFDSFELLELDDSLPDITKIDVDAWYAGYSADEPNTR